MSIKRLTKTRIPTASGEFYLCLYDSGDGEEHMALLMGDLEEKTDVLARVHSECFTGDVLGSRRCDCGEQLAMAMQRVAMAGEGIILYLRQEGRGIGLLSKLKAYDLQDEGYDTVEANIALGHGADERDYSIAAAIFHDLGVTSVRLMTNNPAKIEALEALGIEVTEHIALQAEPNADNLDYLRTKMLRMGHTISLNGANGD
ncbi:MAG: GTP cyclohydrolase II [Chloroflexi bacterium]|nr:GTP cyclohydrolase II [Chloroflexota bacterium]